jgi:hypothetical protein
MRHLTRICDSSKHVLALAIWQPYLIDTLALLLLRYMWMQPEEDFVLIILRSFSKVASNLRPEYVEQRSCGAIWSDLNSPARL